MINKVVNNVDDSLIGIKSEMTLMFGGFGLSGIPENIILSLSQKHLDELRVMFLLYYQTI